MVPIVFRVEPEIIPNYFWNGMASWHYGSNKWTKLINVSLIKTNIFDFDLVMSSNYFFTNLCACIAGNEFYTLYISGCHIAHKLNNLQLILTSFMFPELLSKGLFTLRWGTPDRWGNPLRWDNPSVHIMSHFWFDQVYMIGEVTRHMLHLTYLGSPTSI